METTGTNYNPHALIELRKIQIESGDNMYSYYKATELEGMLWDNPEIDVLETLPNGDVKKHTLTRSDISEMFRKAQYREARIAASEKQLGQIIDNLTMDSWYANTIDKAEVLRDLCEIVGHTPQQEMSWSATLTVSGTTLVNMDEVEDFDIRYHIADNLSVDSNDFDTKVDSWDVDYIDSQEWN